MKKIFALFITICMAITVVSCSANNSNTKQKPQYGIQNDETFRLWTKQVVEEQDIYIGEQNSIEVDSEVFDKVQTMGEKIVNYINNSYNMNWAYEYVPLRLYDFSNTQFKNYNAYYSEKDYILYLNSNYQFDSYGIDYIIAHELIHYIRHLNIGTTDFQYENTNGLGRYMMEALTDLLTIDVYGGTEDVETFFINNSAYCYQVTTMKILSLAIPKIMEYYLQDDIETLEKEFNALSEKYIEFSNIAVENHFVNYLDVIDASYVSYNAMVNAFYMRNDYYFEKYAKAHHDYELGQYELTLMLLRDSNKETKQKALGYIEYMYIKELESEGIYGEEGYTYYKDDIQFLKRIIV